MAEKVVCNVCGVEYTDEDSVRMVKDWLSKPDKYAPCPRIGCTGEMELFGEEAEDQEDQEVLANIKKATKDLAELLKLHDLDVDYYEADWKDTEDLIMGAHDLILKHPGWSIYYIGGDTYGIDCNFVFFTSKSVGEDVVEEIGRLIEDEGAELDEVLPKKPTCPKCMQEIECLIGESPAIVPEKAILLDGELDFEFLGGLRIGDLVTGTPDSWNCPECDEVLFDTKDPDYADKMLVFLKGG